jgi:hypothetical protein
MPASKVRFGRFGRETVEGWARTLFTPGIDVADIFFGSSRLPVPLASDQYSPTVALAGNRGVMRRDDWLSAGRRSTVILW